MSDATVTFLVSRLAIASIEFLIVGILVVAVLACFKGISPQWRRGIWLLAMFKPFVTVLTGFLGGAIRLPASVGETFLGTILFPDPVDAQLLAEGGAVAGLLHFVAWVWLIVTATLLIRVWLRAVSSRQLIDDSLEKGYLLKPSKLKWLDPDLVIPPDARVIVTPEDAGPAALGVYQPAVVVPESLLPWMSQLRDPTPEEKARFCQVLRHELAHLANNDELISRVATVLLSFFWFHPVAHRAYRCVRMNNELRCDQSVVDSGVKPQDYAKTLMNVVAGEFTKRGFALNILGDNSPAGVLRRRLHHLLSDRSRTKAPRKAWAYAIVVLVVLTMPRFLKMERFVEVILADGRVARMTVTDAINYPGGTYEVTPGVYRVSAPALDSAVIMLAEGQVDRSRDTGLVGLGELAELPPAHTPEVDHDGVVLSTDDLLLAKAAEEEQLEEEPEKPVEKKSRGIPWRTAVLIDRDEAKAPILPPSPEKP